MRWPSNALERFLSRESRCESSHQHKFHLLSHIIFCFHVYGLVALGSAVAHSLSTRGGLAERTQRPRFPRATWMETVAKDTRVPSTPRSCASPPGRSHAAATREAP